MTLRALSCLLVAWHCIACGAPRPTHTTAPAPTEAAPPSALSFDEYRACRTEPAPSDCRWRFPMISLDGRFVATTIRLDDASDAVLNEQLVILEVGQASVHRQLVLVSIDDQFMGWDQTSPETLSAIAARVRDAADALRDYTPLEPLHWAGISEHDPASGDDDPSAEPARTQLLLDDPAALGEPYRPLHGEVRFDGETWFRGPIPEREYVRDFEDPNANARCESVSQRSVSAAIAPEHGIMLFDVSYGSWGDLCGNSTTSLIAMRRTAPLDDAD